MELGLINIGEVCDDRGTVHFVEVEKVLPFVVKNVFFIKEVQKDKSRGNHINKISHEFILPITGSFDAIIDGQKFSMDSASQGLLIPAGNHISLINFTDDAICLALCSEKYDSTEKIVND